jgi:ABC-type transport system substrate-binding protein
VGGSRRERRQPPRRDAGDRDASDHHLSQPDDPGLGRPGVLQRAFNPQFTGLANDALVTFQQSPGANGLRLVPDLALAVPSATDGGTTYAFRLRRGIRYSDGQPLRASDFRRGIERLLRVHSPGTTYYSGIVGAAACARHPARCDLSREIGTDNDAGTVVFHLTAPDPQFLYNLTQDGFSAPIPPGTPDHETGSRTVPGTGPYKIAAVSDTRVRFVRNPFLHEWSHSAQPEGNPDAIVWRTAATMQDAVAAVEHGRADWMFGLIPRAQYRQLRLRSPAQIHYSPEFAVDFAPLNTRRAPCGGTSNGYYCNPRLDRQIHQAGLLELSDPTRAAACWESIDRHLTGDAIWVPTVNQREVDVVSRRLRNYEYNPVWGFLVDQAWLR